ncbi:MAG: hypothetical protein EOP83_00455 [Verrucomicrobiaceae bacterium]|nr:MAG: hypothetical protein EOP83_00455 [Verrucomicrobiaceae bacterium]
MEPKTRFAFPALANRIDLAAGGVRGEGWDFEEISVYASAEHEVEKPHDWKLPQERDGGALPR